MGEGALLYSVSAGRNGVIIIVVVSQFHFTWLKRCGQWVWWMKTMKPLFFSSPDNVVPDEQVLAISSQAVKGGEGNKTIRLWVLCHGSNFFINQSL